MIILVTGSHGFVGSNLMKAFGSEFELIRWDARQDAPLPAVDAVIHLAGMVHDLKHTTVAEEYFRVNTELTKQLFDRFLASSAQKFIFFSSIKAQDGDTPYALSKKRAEEYIMKHEESRMKRHQEVYILRPCMICGPGNKGNIKPLFKLVRKGLPWPLAAFDNQRSFASLDNILFVVKELLTRDVDSGIYPVCDDETLSTNDLVKLICECVGKPCHLWRIPQGLMRRVARLGDVLHLPLNSERLGKLTEDYVVDNYQLKRALGIQAMPFRLEDGMRASIQFMMKE